VQRLRELGWTEGHNVAIEYRWADGRGERFAEIAAEFVRLKVDVIVTVGSAIAATKQATSTIPIVFAIAVDPVGAGMVASLARPGGSITGLSIQTAELAGKRIELLRELLPDLYLLAILAIPARSRGLPRSNGPRACSLSKSSCSKSGAPRISRLRSGDSRVGCRHSMCVPTR